MVLAIYCPYCRDLIYPVRFAIYCLNFGIIYIQRLHGTIRHFSNIPLTLFLCSSNNRCEILVHGLSLTEHLRTMMNKESKQQQDISTEQELYTSQVPQRCANCEIEFLWPSIVVQEKTYCCTGCATGGPCCCDYSQYNSVNISGVIHYGPGSFPEMPPNSRDL